MLIKRRYYGKLLSTAFLWLVTLQFSGAQESISNQSTLTYDVSLITPEQLSKFPTIQSVVQDSLGFLWIATVEGLHCTDGNNLVTYNNIYTPGTLEINTAGDGYFRLVQGENNLLWAVEYNTQDVIAINYLTRKEVKRIEIPESSSNGILQTLSNGETYVVTVDSLENAFLLCASCSEIKHISLFKHKEVYNYKSVNNEHWIHADSTYYRYKADGTLIDTYPTNNSQLNWTNGNSVSFYKDLSLHSTLFNEQTGSIDNYLDIPSVFSSINTRYFVLGDEVLLTNTHKSFKIWDTNTNTIQNYSSIVNNLIREESPSGLAGEYRFLLSLANEGFIYSRNNTLILFTPKKETLFDFEEPIESGNQITSMRGIDQDELGNIYASYYTGVAVKKHNEDEFREFRDTKSKNKIAERTYSLTCWEDQLIWNYAVFDLKNNTQRFINRDDYGHHVTHFLEADTLWMFEWFTNNFIKYNLDDKEFELLQEKLLDTEIIVSDINLHPENGHFLLSTPYYGILIYDKNGNRVGEYDIETLQLSNKRTNVYFTEIAGDSLWFGTEIGLGLINLKTLQVTYFTNEVSNLYGVSLERKFYSRVKDSLGNFYLGSDYGICYFDTKKKTFKNLIPNHPLARIEFNRNSASLASDGKYYFGSVDGLFSFYPEDLRYEDEIPFSKPILTSVKIYNRKSTEPTIISSNTANDQSIQLKSADTDVILELLSPSLNYTIFYSYRIPDIKPDWSKPTSENSIELISMPTGDHTVEIRSFLKPNSNNYKSQTIFIHKPTIWYKRSWIIILISLLAILLISSVIYYRFRTILQQKERDSALRTKISSDLHDDVGSVLSGLAIQSEMISYKLQGKDRQELNEISAMSRNAMESMRDIVWAIDSRKDKYENLIDRMRNYAEKNLGRKEINVQFNTSGFSKSITIDPVTRQHIYLIFKEAITNIVRHSNATDVQIQFSKKARELSLIIQDNGTKIESVSITGLGISNMQMRADALGAEVLMNRENGFTVILTMKV